MIKKFTEFIGENYGNRTPDEIAEIEKLAIKYILELQKVSRLVVM